VSSSKRNRLGSLRSCCGGGSLLAGPPAPFADRRALCAFLINQRLLAYLGLGGLFMAVMLQMIRTHQKGYVLGKPDVRKTGDFVDDFDDNSSI